MPRVSSAEPAESNEKGKKLTTQ
nr:hypothetical protein [Sicyoidochytrium minutum DNA virus]